MRGQTSKGKWSSFRKPPPVPPIVKQQSGNSKSNRVISRLIVCIPFLIILIIIIVVVLFLFMVLSKRSVKPSGEEIVGIEQPPEPIVPATSVLPEKIGYDVKVPQPIEPQIDEPSKVQEPAPETRVQDEALLEEESTSEVVSTVHSDIVPEITQEPILAVSVADKVASGEIVIDYEKVQYTKPIPSNE